MHILLITLLAFALGPVERAKYKELRHSGHGDVAYAYKHASPAYREAIPKAIAAVDPDGEHPEWELELWRICHRESWCGKWGTPRVHERDSWAGAGVYLSAWSKGKLNPEECVEHRLRDYSPVRKALKKLERRRGKKRPELHARLDELPTGELSAGEFSTHGGFGMMAGGNVWRLGDCASPREFQIPYKGAFVAAHLFSTCKKWDTDPDTGRRYRRLCNCVEHNAIWMGVGKWKRLLNVQRQDKARRQCGAQPPLTYYQLGEDVVTLVGRFADWVAELVQIVHDSQPNPAVLAKM